jgi:hypothetical protein
MEEQKRTSPSPEKTVKEQLRRRKEKEEGPRNHPTELEEDSLDRTIEDSFPASDPPSSIPDPDEDAA